MDNSQTAKIRRLTDDTVENAAFVELTKEVARTDIDNLWWNAANLTVDTTNEGDRHWKWERIAREYSKDALHACVAIRSEQGYIEGAMAYDFTAKSVLEPALGSVYIDRLATAPRNRAPLISDPAYKGVGSALIYLAVLESYLSGLDGRIVLQSLPTQATIDFYQNKGFVKTDMSQLTTGLIDYELPKAAALVWLKKEGDLP